MKTIKGPAVFLAQFADKSEPFNTLDGICKWASGLGYKGIQIPTWESSLIDLDKASDSQDYCDELIGKVRSYGLEITELSTHLQGQLVAVHPAYDLMFDNFAPDNLKNNPKERTKWAVETVKKAAIASRRLGLKAHATFSGALLWHTWHPWPQAPKGLVEMGFEELAKRWLPILDVFDENGVDVCYEIHPGEDLHDGVTFERFLKATNNHKRVNILYDPSHFILQQLDYITYIDHYHEFIKSWRQVCIYAFPKKALEIFKKQKAKTPLEQIEDIEILRFLELGINVKMLETYGTTQAVDIPEDVDKVLEILSERKS